MLTGTDVLNQLFTHDSWDDLDTFTFVFYDCTFLKDFGCFKHGDVVPYLTVSFDEGIIKETDEKGVCKRLCTIGLVAHKWETNEKPNS